MPLPTTHTKHNHEHNTRVRPHLCLPLSVRVAWVYPSAPLSVSAPRWTHFSPYSCSWAQFLLDMFNGRQKAIPSGFIPFVDVRDTAEAHVLAYEKKEATGRCAWV